MANIDTARVFIPQPTDYVLNKEVYGEKLIGGCDPRRISLMKGVKNIDDIDGMWEFYDVVSYFYPIDLSRAPDVRPCVQCAEYIKKHGNVMSDDTAAIKYLKQNCSTLIIPSATERDYLCHLYYNLVKRSINGFMSDYNRDIPQKFQNIKDRGIVSLLQQIANAPRLR